MMASPRFPLIEIPRPFPSDYATNNAVNFGIDMRCTHNVFLRALNSLWEHAPNVKADDEAGFAGYVRAFCVGMISHHHGEEEIVFPFLETKVSMQENVAQHAAMSIGLEAFADYVERFAQGSEKYDSQRFRQLIEGFGDVLTQHLHDEIDTLSPENLQKFDYKELSKMVITLNNHVAETPGKFSVLPLVATHHNWNEVPEWPNGMPGLVKIFIRYVNPLRYPSYWKFAPFTGSGKPQTWSG